MIRIVQSFAVLVLLPLLTASAAAAAMLTPITAHEILQQVRDAHAPVVLVHLWATWCPPCREEFPQVVALEREYRGHGLKVLLVSADSADNLGAVQDFLQDHKVDYPTFIKAQNDQAFIAGLGDKWRGELPASLFFDSKGTLKAWWPGPGDKARFEQTVQGLLKAAGRSEGSP